jgi:hypothetical protein
LLLKPPSQRADTSVEAAVLDDVHVAELVDERMRLGLWSRATVKERVDLEYVTCPRRVAPMASSSNS